jgi:hypothetical protein
MASRRRFFPSRPVQQVPGRTVELEMLLRRGPAAAAPVSGAGGGDGEGQINGVGWFSPIFDGWWEWEWEELPGGRWLAYAGGDAIESIWEGDRAGMASPAPTAVFRCMEITARANLVENVSTTHVGVVQGSSMTDVRWEAAWDAPSVGDPTVSAGIGNRFRTWGNVIVVEQLNTGGSGGPGGTDWTETLTATAFSGGEAVGTLVINCFHPAY